MKEKTSPAPVIPDKLYFKIGEVGRICGLKPYVLRYWESEFNIKPVKSKKNQRLYQRKDIDQFLKIKQLLYEERFTIAGAKPRLKKGRAAATPKEQQLDFSQLTQESFRDTLLLLKKEVEELRRVVQ